jgi:hypothetical protein
MLSPVLTQSSSNILHSKVHHHDELGLDLPVDIKHLPLTQWDKAVFDHELRHLQSATSDGSKPTSSPKKLQEGSYAGTQLALTEMFHRIEKGYASVDRQPLFILTS